MKSEINNIKQTPLIHIGTDDVRKRMGEILDCVNLRGDEFLIERKNKPLAVLIPVQKHDALTKLAKELILQAIANAKNELSEEEAMDLINEAKHVTRKEKSKSD
jgi:prevent-host-death family protein